MYRQFAKIFETFRIAEPEKKVEAKVDGQTAATGDASQTKTSVETDLLEDDDDEVIYF